jgi:hypothetical protein
MFLFPLHPLTPLPSLLCLFLDCSLPLFLPLSLLAISPFDLGNSRLSIRLNSNVQALFFADGGESAHVVLA